MNGWFFTGVALWLLLNFIGTVASVVGIGCDDEPVQVRAVFALATAITSWAMFIGFCLRMGGAL